MVFAASKARLSKAGIKNMVKTVETRMPPTTTLPSRLETGHLFWQLWQQVLMLFIAE